MRDLNELNLNEGGQPVRRDPPTAEAIAALESRFEVKLPPDYVTLLNFSNGGHPELDAFRLVDSSEDIWGVNRFYPLADERTNLEHVWGATENWRKVLPVKLVAFASDGGGNVLFLSYDTDPPHVALCYHDPGLNVVKVANSFGEFVDMLYLDPDMI